MKRILSVFLAVLMCVLPLAANISAVEVPSSAKAVYTFSNVSAYPEENISVSLSLETFTAFKAAGITGITYDKNALTFDGATIEAAFGDLMFVKSFTANNMTLVAAAMTAIDSYEGKILTLHFTVNKDAEVGEYTIAGTPSFQDTSAVVEAFLIPGTVTVLGQDFSGLSLKDKTVTYNGEVHNVEVTGVPANATVAYTVDGEAFNGTKMAGTYEVTATVTAPGFNKWEETATLTINKKDLVLDANVPDKVYDGTATIENFADYVTLEGVVEGDNVSIDYSNLNLSYFASHAGTWTLAGNAGVRGGDLPNYNLIESWKEAKATITPKPITVKADDITVKVGADMPTLTYTAEGLVEGDTLLGITLTTKANTKTVKEYPITVKANTNYDKNYKITTVNGTFKVIDKTAQDVTVAPVEGKTYGDDDFMLDVAVGEVANESKVAYKSETPGVVSVTDEGCVMIVGAGTAKITVSKAGDNEYADFSETVTFTVAKKNVTVKATDVTVTKGDAIPALTEYTVEGLVKGDELAVTLTTTAKNSNTVKDYPITVKVAANANYNITTVNGTLSVIDKTKQDITVTPNVPSDLTYGDEGFKIDVAYGNVVTEAETVFASDDEEVVTVDAQGNVTVVGAGEAVITVSKAGNATIADFKEEIEVVVAKKPITITANDAYKKVGNADPALTYTVTGEFVGNDTLTGNVAREEGEDVGTYIIGPGTLSITNGKNYDFTFIGGMFEIFSKPQQDVTVEKLFEKTYGDEESFNLGVVLGDKVTASRVEYAVEGENITVDEQGRVTVLGAGTAKITVTKAGDEEYADFEKVVTVEIAKRKIVVTADSFEIYVDSATPALTYTYEGTLVGDDEFTGELSVQNGNVGGKSYPIAQGTLTLGDNYEIEYNVGLLKILKKLDQDVFSSKALEAYYGVGIMWIISLDEADRYNSDEEVSIVSSNEDVAVVEEGTNIRVVGAGETEITVSVPGNYKFNDFEESFTFKVKQKPITVTANDTGKKIGNADPELTYSYDEAALVAGDTFSGALTREAGEKIGEYDILQGTLTLGDNYKITFVPATFKIFDKTPQDVTVTKSYSKVYGDAFDLEVELGQNVTESPVEYAVVSGNVSVDAEGRVTVLGAGTAKISVTKAGDEDYAAVEETVTVYASKREIKVTAEAKEKYVDQETPSLTYIYEGELVEGDAFTGELAVSDGNRAGRSYDIKIGTLALNDNYKVTFVGAKLSVLAKVDQDITFIAPEETMYGVVTLTWYVNLGEEVYEDGVLTVTSSNEAVVVLEDYAGRENGSIVIKSVGKTVLTAKYTGNEKYNDWEDSITLVVKKCPYIVTVEDKVKKIGNADPEYTFSLETHEYGPGGENLENGTLGVTITREEGEELGKYDITAVVDVDTALYDVKVNKGTLTIIDKLPSTVVTEAEIEKTYGDVSFEIEAEVAEIELPGEGFSLPFRYSSDNENVVMFPEEDEGNAIIVGAGTATVTVYYDGDNEYAASSAEIAVTVLPKEVAIEELDVVNKTVVFEGMIAADAGMLSVDFNKLTFVPEEVGEGQTPENYVVTGLTLAGDKSANYVLTTESVLVPISDEIELVNVTATAENGTVEGMGSYIAGSEVTLKATPARNYKFDGWYVGEEKVSSAAEYTFTAEEDIELTAKFRKSGGSVGGGGTPKRTVYFNVSEGVTNTVFVDKGAKVQRPEDPTLEGYTFEGWFTDAEYTEEYDFDEAVDMSITLYAKWTKVETPAEGDGKDPAEGEGEGEGEGEDKPDAWKSPYVDVDKEDWFYNVVKTVTQAGLMNGVAEDKFAPDMLVTRAMVVTMLHRAEDEPYAINETKFDDVAEGSYFADAVAWAAENGIVNGYSETEFAPDENITREQIAAIIFRYAAFKGIQAIELSENLFFDDADEISSYAVAPMNWLVGKEIITGYADGTLKPQGNATRAEVAAITARILEFFAQ